MESVMLNIIDYLEKLGKLNESVTVLNKMLDSAGLRGMSGGDSVFIHDWIMFRMIEDSFLMLNCPHATTFVANGYRHVQYMYKGIMVWSTKEDK